MVCPIEQVLIHSLKLVDYPSVQTENMLYLMQRSVVVKQRRIVQWNSNSSGRDSEPSL